MLGKLGGEQEECLVGADHAEFLAGDLLDDPIIMSKCVDSAGEGFIRARDILVDRLQRPDLDLNIPTPVGIVAGEKRACDNINAGQHAQNQGKMTYPADSSGNSAQKETFSFI